MLGETHSLVADFPEMAELVVQLSEDDQAFAKLNGRYNALDKEIRELELEDSPITDNAMQTLKHERAELKDVLYQSLLKAKNNGV